MENNPIGLMGMDFIEFAGADMEFYHMLFSKFGFKKSGKHNTKDVYLYRQGDINCVVNHEAGSFASNFSNVHGPSLCATGFRVENAEHAFNETVKRGAKPFEGETSYPAIYGIGDSLIYFIEKHGDKGEIFADDFQLTNDDSNKPVGLNVIDHLTNNVPVGEMQKWCDFYEKIFNFREVRYFDIQGNATGLISKVMKSPCGKIIVPINEPKDPKSQIQEYLEEYKGSGIQHLAFSTDDICQTLEDLKNSGIEFLEVPDTYYDMLPERLPNVTEDMKVLSKHKILADGDPEGYLLQIFTKNLVGPIFVEIIQRKNHYGFGEGNFQALFDAIERDQRERGVL